MYTYAQMHTHPLTVAVQCMVTQALQVHAAGFMDLSSQSNSALLFAHMDSQINLASKPPLAGLTFCCSSLNVFTSLLISSRQLVPLPITFLSELPETYLTHHLLGLYSTHHHHSLSLVTNCIHNTMIVMTTYNLHNIYYSTKISFISCDISVHLVYDNGCCNIFSSCCCFVHIVQLLNIWKMSHKQWVHLHNGSTWDSISALILDLLNYFGVINSHSLSQWIKSCLNG